MKDLSLHILDLVHNAATAKATQIEINIVEDKTKNCYTICVMDNGQGIKPEILHTVTDPYTTNRKTRKVGMGLPLLKHSAEQAGGAIHVESETGKGTKVTAAFEHVHIDRPPLGDIAGVLVQLIVGFEDIRFKYHHQTGNGDFSLDTDEITEMLEGVSVNNPEVRKFLREMIDENLADIQFDQ